MRIPPHSLKVLLSLGGFSFFAQVQAQVPPPPPPPSALANGPKLSAPPSKVQKLATAVDLQEKAYETAQAANLHTQDQASQANEKHAKENLESALRTLQSFTNTRLRQLESNTLPEPTTRGVSSSSKPTQGSLPTNTMEELQRKLKARERVD